MNTITRTASLGAAFAVLVACATSANAQLAMSYKLDVRSERAEQQAVTVNRCTAFNWMTSIGACGRELFSRIAQVGRPDGATYEAVTSGVELPELGGPVRDFRLLRSGGGKEALIASSKTAELLVRVGAKMRVRNNDDGGWEYYRFTDAKYESHVKANAHKAVGLELLVPFQ
jgi:hypothetical protein